MQNSALIIDFGSSYTQLIARKVREYKIYCEIHPFNQLPDKVDNFKALILSDLPSSVKDIDKMQPDLSRFSKDVPVLAVGGSERLVTDKSREIKTLETGFYQTDEGGQAINEFLLKTAGLDQNWTPESFVKSTVSQLKNDIGEEKVVLGLSGGVDSSVTAVLLNQAIGDRLYCIFVNTGLLRKNEFTDVLEQYKHLGLNVKGVDASERFLKALNGVSDPEKKRKIIGKLFIEVFEEEANNIQGVKYLGQGTIYPDVIESVSIDGSVSVKSHHNVGGLPEHMDLQVVEPLKNLFKDEVRRVGKELGMKPELIGRHPFPGPGLAIRVLGKITADKVKVLQEADAIFINTLKEWGLYDKVWQAGAILLPVSSVGKKDDKRTYEKTIALRAVESRDGMTARWVDLPYDFLQEVSNKIINCVEGINRVVYDISSKPPATIEWE